MTIFKVTEIGYYRLIRKLSASVFHRIDAEGNYLIKCLKSVESEVKKYSV